MPDDRVPYEGQPEAGPLPPFPTAEEVQSPPLPLSLPAATVGDVLQICDFLRAMGPSLQLQGFALPSYTPAELLSELASTDGLEPPDKLVALHVNLLQMALADDRIKVCVLSK